MTGLNSEMWNEQHDIMIKDFLIKSEIQLLVFFIDVIVKGDNDPANFRLVSQNEMPFGSTNEYSYFIKSYYSQEINTQEIFQKHVQYGNFSGKSLSSLLRLTSGLYAPLFFGNKNWPDSNTFKLKKT